MTYDFEKAKEAGWFVATAAGIAVATVLVDFDPARITDWRAWAIGIAGAAVRAAAGAILAIRAKGK